MAIGVGEVDTPPAVVVVDLARAVAHRVGPVFKPLLADAAENSVKIRIADQEGVVLWADRAFGVGEVERGPVVEFHHVDCAMTAAQCTGAFVLAEAGVLDGRHATTHWRYARELQARFPKVKVDEDRIFINDGPIWTSAGMSSGIDLALALLDNDLGPDAAKLVARLLVMNQRRLGGQMQHSALLDMTPKSDRIELVLAHIRRNLRNPLTIDELADVANLSPRQFSRAFVTETGQSPAKAVERLRLEAARFMLEQGQHTINVIAQETGFADRERMRRAFLRTFGVPADVLRRSARREPARGN